MYSRVRYKYISVVLMSIIKYTFREEHEYVEVTTSYSYHEEVGIPLARDLREAEENRSDLRIVGGKEVKLGENPFFAGIIVSLVTKKKSVCGSTLLTHTRAVTAAHCWHDAKHEAREFTMVFASLKLFSGGTRVKTRQVITHPKYSIKSLLFDCAMIAIPHIDFDKNIQPAQLPYGLMLNNLFVGIKARSIGFGRQGDNLPPAIGHKQRLHYVNLMVVENAICLRTFSRKVVNSYTLCAAGEPGKGNCAGDSGGPLVINVNGKWMLIGITSYGVTKGCEKNYPMGLSRATSFTPWIKKLIKREFSEWRSVIKNVDEED